VSFNVKENAIVSGMTFSVAVVVKEIVRELEDVPAACAAGEMKEAAMIELAKIAPNVRLAITFRAVTIVFMEQYNHVCIPLHH
jgi:hypothetical protein